MNLVMGIGCIVCGGVLIVGFAYRLEFPGMIFGVGILFLGLVLIGKSKHIKK